MVWPTLMSCWHGRDRTCAYPINSRALCLLSYMPRCRADTMLFHVVHSHWQLPGSAPYASSGATSTCEVGRHGVNATRRHWDTAIRLRHRVIGMGVTFGRKKTTRVIRMAGFGHTSSAPLDHIRELHACNSYFFGEFFRRVWPVPCDPA